MILQGLKGEVQKLLGLKGQNEADQELGIGSQNDDPRQDSMSALVAHSLVHVCDSNREG